MKMDFSYGARLENLDRQVRIMPRAPKIFLLIFYHHKRAQQMFTEESVIFSILALFQKTKLEKASVRSTEEVRAKQFCENQEG